MGLDGERDFVRWMVGITSPMLLHDTAVIPATNVKALRSNILIQPAPHQEMNLLRMKETKERRNRKETIAAY